MSQTPPRVLWDNQINTPDPDGVFLIQLDAYIQETIGAKLLSLGLKFPDEDLKKSLSRSATVDSTKRTAYQWLGIQIMTASPFELTGDFLEGDDWSIDIEIDPLNPAHYIIHAVHPVITNPVFTVGTVTTGEPGTDVIVEINEDLSIDFTIPRGNPGDPGDDGNDGSTPFTDVDVTTLSPGSSATASISSNTLHLGIPRGNTGSAGTPAEPCDPCEDGEDGEDGEPGNPPPPPPPTQEGQSAEEKRCAVADYTAPYLDELYEQMLTKTNDIIGIGGTIGQLINGGLVIAAAINPIGGLLIAAFTSAAQALLAGAILSQTPTLTLANREDIMCALYHALPDDCIITDSVLSSWKTNLATVPDLTSTQISVLQYFVDTWTSNTWQTLAYVGAFGEGNCAGCDEDEEENLCATGVVDFRTGMHGWRLTPADPGASWYSDFLVAGGTWVSGEGFKETEWYPGFHKVVWIDAECPTGVGGTGWQIQIKGASNSSTFYVQFRNEAGVLNAVGYSELGVGDFTLNVPIPSGTTRIMMGRSRYMNFSTIVSVEIHYVL